MTKRFFYTDPLAAIWMAKHFGMMFTDDSIWGYQPGKSIIDLLDSVMKGPVEAKIYTHPDSLTLLEPQVDDCCEWIGSPDKRHYSEFCEEDNDFGGRIECLRIVARNGIPFMWPESEGA
jgi:hypothetical protein